MKKNEKINEKSESIQVGKIFSKFKMSLEIFLNTIRKAFVQLFI